MGIIHCQGKKDAGRTWQPAVSGAVRNSAADKVRERKSTKKGETSWRRASDSKASDRHRHENINNL